MSKPYVNAYINNLQRQITTAALRLARKQKAKEETFSTQAEKKEEYIWSKVDVQKYELVNSDAAYALIGKRLPIENDYVSKSYSAAANVSAKPTVVEGMVFKNNQEFDFKV